MFWICVHVLYRVSRSSTPPHSYIMQGKYCSVWKILSVTPQALSTMDDEGRSVVPTSVLRSLPAMSLFSEQPYKRTRKHDWSPHNSLLVSVGNFSQSSFGLSFIRSVDILMGAVYE